MRLSRLTLIAALLLSTQLVSFDPQYPQETPASRQKAALAFLETHGMDLGPGPSSYETAPTYRGKRWWGLCPAYAADSVSALYREYQASPRLQQALSGFDWGRAHLVTLASPQRVHVAYAAEAGVAWSSKPLILPAGEVMITDRDDPRDESSGFLVRTFCCNTVSSVVRPPVRRDEPPIEELGQEWYLRERPSEVPGFLPPVITTPGGGVVPPVIGIPIGAVVVPPSVIVIPPLITIPPHVVIYHPPGEVPHGPPLHPRGGENPPFIPPGGDDGAPVPPGLHPTPPDGPHPVPEPSTMALLALGFVTLYLGRKLYAQHR